MCWAGAPTNAFVHVAADSTTMTANCDKSSALIMHHFECDEASATANLSPPTALAVGQGFQVIWFIGVLVVLMLAIQIGSYIYKK